MKCNNMNLDYGMIALNATSVTALALSWIGDNLNTAGGFIVMLSIAALNFAKAFKEYKTGKETNKPSNNEENEF